MRNLQHKTSETTLDTLKQCGLRGCLEPKNWKWQEGPLAGASEGTAALGNPDLRRLVSRTENTLLLFGASVSGHLSLLTHEAPRPGRRMSSLIAGLSLLCSCVSGPRIQAKPLTQNSKFKV